MSGERPARVEVGVLSRPHGLGGELVLAGARLAPAEVLGLGTVYARAKDGAERALVVRAVRPFLHQLLVRFEGVADRDQAAALAGRVVWADAARLPVPEEGTVYLFQLLDLRVVTVEGRALGRVADVWATGAAPVLVVRDQPAGPGERPRERLLPMSPDVLVGVDLAEGTIEVRLLPGLDEL